VIPEGDFGKFETQRDISQLVHVRCDQRMFEMNDDELFWAQFLFHTDNCVDAKNLNLVVSHGDALFPRILHGFIFPVVCDCSIVN
jgi:hypothetical protein